MPIYDYKCSTCDNRVQLVRKITDDSCPPCKVCGSEDTEKLISPSAFVLKGSGWYLTDYSNKNKPSESEAKAAEASSSSESSSSESSSSETKPSAPAAPSSGGEG
jgi:putative FmdB family regulatory protein